MTISDWKKAFKQLKAKPIAWKKFLKHSAPKERTTGYGKYRCEQCGRFGGRVAKYGLTLCRCCFREIATKIGFKKYS